MIALDELATKIQMYGLASAILSICGNEIVAHSSFQKAWDEAYQNIGVIRDYLSSMNLNITELEDTDYTDFNLTDDDVDVDDGAVQ